MLANPWDQRRSDSQGRTGLGWTHLVGCPALRPPLKLELSRLPVHPDGDTTIWLKDQGQVTKYPDPPGWSPTEASVLSAAS